MYPEMLDVIDAETLEGSNSEATMAETEEGA